MNSASAIKFLYAAYTATWVIHALYLGSLVSRYRRLRRRMKELASGSRLPASGQ
jgi:CcmD family protein